MNSPADAELMAAIDWKLRLSSSQAGQQDQQAFEQWLADPRHLAAWQRLEQPLQDLQPLAGQPGVRHLLGNSRLLSQRRRRLLGGGLGVLAIACTGWLGTRRPALPEVHTTLAERQRLTLPDRSQLLLNANSQAEWDFSQDQRLLRLHKGELIIDVATDRQRPFIVRTRHGEVRALGTRILVRQTDSRTLVLMLEHQGQLRLADGRQQRLEEHQAAWLSDSGIQLPQADQLHQAAWEHGRLELRDQPLQEAIEALDNYLPGWIRLSPEVAGLPVFGSFSLDRPWQILESLEQTFPLQIRRYGPLTLIDKR